MKLFETTCKTAVALSLTLLATGFAYADGLGSLGSTDLYHTNFQQAFAAGDSAPQAVGATGALGSVDIYHTDFQKAFASSPGADTTATAEAMTGTVDIYSTDFQKI